MEIKNSAQNIIDTIKSFFPKEYLSVSRNIALAAYAVMRSEKASPAEIARTMGEVNGYGFKANIMRVYRLLKSHWFQVDDRLWRGYINYIFSFLKEMGIKKGQNIVIAVDYTSDRNDFLILVASVVIQNQSIPLYFSLRNYPKRAGAINQKKMEEAFFKALRHILPKGYTYTILADRGFGNLRIIEILEKNKFQYILRINDSLLVEHNGKEINVADLPHRSHTLKNILVLKWKRTINLVKKVDGDSHWILAVSHPSDQTGQLYSQRFSIEAMFKNAKSGGLHLESTLVDKYDRFKRLLFIAFLGYATLIFAGLFIKNKAHPIKKNYSLLLNILTQFSD